MAERLKTIKQSKLYQYHYHIYQYHTTPQNNQTSGKYNKNTGKSTALYACSVTGWRLWQKERE